MPSLAPLASGHPHGQNENFEPTDDLVLLGRDYEHFIEVSEVYQIPNHLH